MKKTPILMLVAIVALLIASYVISYHHKTLNIDSTQNISYKH